MSNARAEGKTQPRNACAATKGRPAGRPVQEGSMICWFVTRPLSGSGGGDDDGVGAGAPAPRSRSGGDARARSRSGCRSSRHSGPWVSRRSHRALRSRGGSRFQVPAAPHRRSSAAHPSTEPQRLRQASNRVCAHSPPSRVMPPLRPVLAGGWRTPPDRRIQRRFSDQTRFGAERPSFRRKYHPRHGSHSCLFAAASRSTPKTWANN